MSEIPNDRQPFFDEKTGKISRPWWTFFASLGVSSRTVTEVRTIVDDKQDAADTLGDIASMTTPGYLVHAGGGITSRTFAEGEGVTLTNPSGQAGNTVIALAELVDTGAGEGLWKFTRDGFGRVEGTQEATAADLAYVDTFGHGVLDTQAAIDFAMGGLPYIGDTAPDPTLYKWWINATTFAVSVYYDDGDTEQWVETGNAGGGGSASMPAVMARISMRF